MATDDTLVTGPLSVNVDALWLVQALLGVERLAPELRTRPYGAARNDEWVGEHPGLQSLREAGVVDANGEVIPDLASRLAILNAPDVEVVILVARGQVAWGAERLGDPTTWRTIPEDQLRVVLARRDGKWVSAARAGDDITIDAIAAEPGLGEPAWLAGAALGLMDSAYPCEPSKIPPVNVPADQLISAVAQGGSATSITLRDLGLRGPALAELNEALEQPLAEAMVYARVYDDAEVRSATTALDIRATEAGRVTIHRLAAVRGSDQEWMAIAPATTGQVEAGIKSVLASLNIRNWAEHKRF